MSDALLQRLAESAQPAGSLYHRLVLLVGPEGTGKTRALREFAQQNAIPLVNLNLELSRRLLDVPRARRAMSTPPLLKEVAASVSGGLLVLDNTEILFAPDLQIDPLRALQQLSRDRTVVSAWNGQAEGGRLTYAEPGHPEFRDYPIQDLVLVVLASRPGPTGP